MEWNSFGDIIENVFTLAGGAAGIFVFVVGVAQASGKKWVDHWFEKKNKKYQQELDDKSKLIQSQLDTKLALLQIKEQQLGSVRMSAISETYEAMGKLTTEAQRLFAFFKSVNQEPDEVIYKNLCEHGNIFIAIWNKNKLYFPKDISDAIYEMNKNLHVNASMYFMLKSDNSDKQYEYVTEMNNYLPKTIEHIEKRFREVIGVETTKE